MTFLSADIKHQEIKEMVTASYNVYEKYLQNLKINAKQLCIFH